MWSVNKEHVQVHVLSQFRCGYKKTIQVVSIRRSITVNTFNEMYF